jgi:hypothetical protein
VSIGGGAGNPSGGMSKFKITLARIESLPENKKAAQVRITFQIVRGHVRFQVPILLNISDFDDTEMVQAARSALNRVFVELAEQSKEWKLTAQELQLLSGISSRPRV